jgi:hypothetical protein
MIVLLYIFILCLVDVIVFSSTSIIKAITGESDFHRYGDLLVVPNIIGGYIMALSIQSNQSKKIITDNKYYRKLNRGIG